MEYMFIIGVHLLTVNPKTLEVLTGSSVPRQYSGDVMQRESQLLTICLQLKLESSDKCLSYAEAIAGLSYLTNQL